MNAGTICFMKKKHQKKLTLLVPEDLLAQALEASGEGIAATVKQGLTLIAARRAYTELKKLRGKVRVSFNLDELRDDK